MVVVRYPLSQSSSCETMRILWSNCKSNIGPMHDHKSRYTEELCETRIAEINAADALPDEAARAAVHEMLRFQLENLGKTNTGLWKCLKSYINGVYTNDAERKIQYRAAGWANYEDAAADTWQAVNDLMQSGSNYIAANAVALAGEDNDNMPAGFPADFNAGWLAFTLKRSEFEKALSDSPKLAADKITAINDCYKNTVDMDIDGQIVFADDDELKKLFSFEAQGKLVEGTPPASFEVLVLVNGVPKQGAEISIENTDKALVSGSDGKALFTQMRNGDLTANIICDGFSAKTVSETLTAGVRKRITVTLEPLFDGAMKVGSEKPENTAAPKLPEGETVNGSMQ